MPVNNTIAITSANSRNRNVEQERGQLTFFNDFASLHEQRNDGSLTEVWQVAQSMIVCGLPYDEIEDTLWERTARLGDGSILTTTFSASVKGVSLPFGQDRGPLYFMFNRAFETYQSILRSLPPNVEEAEKARRLEAARFVEWDIAADYLKMMNKCNGGTEYRALADRLERISSCNISIVRTSSSVREQSAMPIIKRSRMPRWANKDKGHAGSNVVMLTTKPEGRCGFEISPDYFRDFIEHHVPVPAEVLRKLLRRPRHLDLFSFLCWRSFAAESVSFIPLDSLQEQIGSTDKNQRRLAKHLKEIIDMSRRFGWKELNAEVTYDDNGRRGLRIGKPQNNIHFLPPAR